MKRTKRSGSQGVALWRLLSCRDTRTAAETERLRNQQRWIALCLGVSVLWVSVGIAKQKQPATRTISGQVLNGANQGIAGASVLLRDLQTHKTNAIYSGSGGAYNFSGLNAYHDYEVQARYRGMISKTREVSSMDPRLQIVVNLTVSAEDSRQD